MSIVNFKDTPGTQDYQGRKLKTRGLLSSSACNDVGLHLNGNKVRHTTIYSAETNLIPDGISEEWYRI